MSDNTKGFSLTELIIAISLGAIMSIFLFSITIFMYGGVIQNQIRAESTLESQDILRAVVEDLRISAGILPTNNISDPNEPVGGWATSNANTILIISVPATDSANQFIIDTLSGDPFQNEYIYFTDGSNLFKRILANPNAPGNTATTTCPEPLATPSCPADRLLSKNFASMNFKFYDQDDIETTDLLLAKSIEINIELARQALGQLINTSNQIRVTMRNTL